MRGLALSLLFLMACGGAQADEIDCSAATCSVVDTKERLGCQVSPPACAHAYAQVCPPSPSFAPICGVKP